MGKVQSVDIYGTLGPACADADTLERMIRAGMTGLRVNLSHTLLRDALPQVRLAREAAARCGAELRILLDMQGPELRIGDLSSPRELRPGETVRLGGDGIPVPDMVRPCLRPGQTLLLDDGVLSSP